MIIAIAVSACSLGNVTEVDSIYPMVVPDDPSIVMMIDEYIKGMEADGYTFLGMACDENGDTMVWMSNADGECEAALLMFTMIQVMPVDCDDAFEMWGYCIDAGGCLDPEGKRRITRSEGV